MKKNKVYSLILFSLACSNVFAGGLLTNTNQNIAFNRNMARDGVIGIDGVYSNPAGVAFLSKGLHISFNIQNAYQTRTIESGITVPALQGTPFHQPFKLNGGDEDGIKKFKGEASVPILPSLQAALVKDRWTLQFGFALQGGGGKATFNKGLASFERQISLIPALLYQQGMTSSTPSYSLNSYMNGRQYIYGTQIGATYKINENLAVYGGFRFNYIWNKYEGNITNVSANIDGKNENLFQYFGDKASALGVQAATYSMMAANTSDAATKAKYEAIAKQYEVGAEKAENSKNLFADKYLECTQEGWGITPIIGIDYKYGKWNFASRLEFTNHLNIENHTKQDDTGLFTDGVNTPNDLPGLWTLGTQYKVTDNWRIMASFHYFFDKNAKMADGKQKLLGGNTTEYLAGTEYDITKNILVSAGFQRTKYDLANGDYLSDLSFVTSSYSIGFGAKAKISKNVSMNIAYFWTKYETFDKKYNQTIAVGDNSVSLENTDSFSRTNKVLGVGLDITI